MLFSAFSHWYKIFFHSLLHETNIVWKLKNNKNKKCSFKCFNIYNLNLEVKKAFYVLPYPETVLQGLYL